MEETERILGGGLDVPTNPEVDAYFDKTVGGRADQAGSYAACGITSRRGQALDRIGGTERGPPGFPVTRSSGADIVDDICHRLKFSRAAGEFVVSVVRHHMRPWTMASPGTTPSGRAIRDFRQRAGGAAVAVLFLHLADYRGARGPMLTTQEWRDRVELVDRMLTGVLEQEAPGGGAAGLLP